MAFRKLAGDWLSHCQRFDFFPTLVLCSLCHLALMLYQFRTGSADPDVENKKYHVNILRVTLLQTFQNGAMNQPLPKKFREYFILVYVICTYRQTWLVF